MSYQIKIPSSIYGAEGCIEKIKEIIVKEQAKELLVFTDQGIISTGLADLLFNELRRTQVKFRED